MRSLRWILAGALLATGLWAQPAAADTCTARTDTPNYSHNTQVPVICDEHGSLRVTLSGSGGGLGTASDAAPTLSEGAVTGFSFDLDGNVRAMMMGTATEDAPTYTEGATASLSVDLNGSLRTNLTHTLAGEAVADDVLKVEQRGYYTSITTAATTVVKSGPGWFQGCHVLGGTLGNVTIYDNTAASGAVVVAAFTPATSDDLKSINTSFSVGLTVVTAAAMNMTCVVR